MLRRLFERDEPMKMKKTVVLPLGTLLLFLITLAAYALTGRNEFTTTLSMKVIVPLGIATAFELLSIFKGIQVLEYAAYLCGLYAWLEYLSSQIYYIVNVFVAIDGTMFSAGFLLTTVAGLLAWVFALLAAKQQTKAVDAA